MALRVDPNVGLNVGLDVGVNGDVTPYVPPTWTSDVNSGIGLPQNNTEWSAVSSDAGVAPFVMTSIYLLQDAASPLADAIGAFPLAAAGAGHLYEQVIAGWAAKAVRLTAGTTGSWVNTDAGLPDLSATSSLLYMVVDIPAGVPAATRNMAGLGTNAAVRQMITTGLLNNFSGAASVSGAASPLGRVMPIWLKVDQTGNAQIVYTDQETITAVFGAVTGKACRLGSTAAALAVGILYAARADGADAERSDADIKAVSESLGWTMPP